MEQLQKEILVADFVRDCVDVPLFAECCSACPRHGKTWSCPPFAFQPEEIWARYQTLRLQCRVIPVPETLREQLLSIEEINHISFSLLKDEKHSMLMEMLEQEKQHQESMALSAGNCNLCNPDTCSRMTNEPCRNLSMMRYSIEALGGNVGKALELYFGKQILWATDGFLPEYYILLGGLLIK